MDIQELTSRINAKEIDPKTKLWVFDFYIQEGDTKRPGRHIPPQLCEIRSYNYGYTSYWSISFYLLSKKGTRLSKSHKGNNAQFFQTEDECRYEYEKACVENIRKIESLKKETVDTLDARIDQIKDRLQANMKP